MFRDVSGLDFKVSGSGCQGECENPTGLHRQDRHARQRHEREAWL